ncbi:MAG: sterol desaturase family protein [Gemmataceae bacterium]|nr:sterol desaturase family protein [Gemmataceae bacterium]
MAEPSADLPGLAANVARVCVWLAILVAVFVPLERLFAARPQRLFRKGVGTDLAYYFLSSLVPAFLLAGPVGLLAWAVHRVVPAGVLEAAAGLPLGARVAAAFVAGEVGYYWGHRLSHVVPVLWRFHAIHHSAEHVDFLVNSRAHPVDMVFGRFCGLVPIYVLGLGGPAGLDGTLVPVLVVVLGTVWGFFIHANLRWRFGPLEWLVTTPAFHHWHHTKSGPINHNYASTLPWLDRLFGTHHLPAEFPADYGIRAKVPDGLIDQLLYPLVPDPPAPADPGHADPPAAPTAAGQREVAEAIR